MDKEDIYKYCVENSLKLLNRQINREGIEFYIEDSFDSVVLYYRTPHYKSPQRSKTTKNYREMELILAGLTGYSHLIERLDQEEKNE